MAPIVPVVLAAARLYKYGKKPGKKVLQYILKKRKIYKGEKASKSRSSRGEELPSIDSNRLLARKIYGPKLKPTNTKDLREFKFKRMLGDERRPFVSNYEKQADSFIYQGLTGNRNWQSLMKKAEKRKGYNPRNPKRHYNRRLRKIEIADEFNDL